MIPIVIPSYEPDESLNILIDDLCKNNIFPIVVVNDGSGNEYEDIFKRVEKKIIKNNGILLKHDVNKGKGRALKTAFNYVLENYPDATGVITADSDGQHSPKNIIEIRNTMEENIGCLILGCRDFIGQTVPWANKAGNKITETVFKLVSGKHISDTQTGLRGIPREFMRFLLNVKGERFEFEIRMLLEAVNKLEIVEVPIETIYDSKTNHKSHFNKVKDSFKIYSILFEKFIKFIVSSLSSSAIDILLFSTFCYLLKKSYASSYIYISTVLARIISSIYNYSLNYLFVFKSKKNITASTIEYALLAFVQMNASAICLNWLVSILKYKEYFLKIIVDGSLFIINYFVQKKIIFNKK